MPDKNSFIENLKATISEVSRYYLVKQGKRVNASRIKVCGRIIEFDPSVPTFLVRLGRIFTRFSASERAISKSTTVCTCTTKYYHRAHGRCEDVYIPCLATSKIKVSIYLKSIILKSIFQSPYLASIFLYLQLLCALSTLLVLSAEGGSVSKGQRRSGKAQSSKVAFIPVI